MIKQTWIVSDDEKSRILNLHETATKKQYLFFEQRIETKTIEPKKFVLPNNAFASGKYKEFDKSAVDGVIAQLMDYIKDYPQNQQLN